MACVKIYFQPQENKLDSQGKPTGDMIPAKPFLLGQVVFSTAKNNYVSSALQIDQAAVAAALAAAWAPSDKAVLEGRLQVFGREQAVGSGLKARLAEEINSLQLSTGDPQVVAIEFVRRMLAQTQGLRFSIEGPPVSEPQNEGTNLKESEGASEPKTTNTSPLP